MPDTPVSVGIKMNLCKDKTPLQRFLMNEKCVNTQNLSMG